MIQCAERDAKSPRIWETCDPRIGNKYDQKLQMSKNEGIRGAIEVRYKFKTRQKWAN